MRIRVSSVLNLPDDPKKILEKVCLLKGAPDSAITALASNCVVKACKKAEILFLETEPLKRVYFVGQGSVRLLRQTLAGEESVFQLILPYGAVAAVESLTAETYPFSAETIQQSTLLSVAKQVFVDLVSQSPLAYRNCLRCATLKFGDLSTVHRDLMKEKTELRLAKVILSLADAQHCGNAAGPLMLPTSRVLADLIGCTPETILRLLAQFRRQGILEKRGSSTVFHREQLLICWPSLDSQESCTICSGRT